METKTLQNDYMEKLSSKLQKLNLEEAVFQAKADKAVGLAKAKYLEQMKSIQEKKERINNFMKQIMKEGIQGNKIEILKKIDNIMKEIDNATEEEKQRLSDLFG